MKVAVLGSGYVGLVTGACLAEKGHSVIVYDIDHFRIGDMKEGKIPFYEPGLEELVKSTLQQKQLSFTDELSDAVNNAQIIFVAVGPPQSESNIIDTSYVLNAAESVGEKIKNIKDYKVIVVKSTVPPGTTRSLIPILSKYRALETFGVASNPEFLKEGSAINDFRSPDRIVIGASDEKSEDLLKQLYLPFIRTGAQQARFLSVEIESSELIKYCANLFLACRIASMNELAILAEKVGANIDEVRIGIGSDPRIGPHFLFSGPGYGGSCFPKDVAGIVEFARGHDVNLSIAKAVDESNRLQRCRLADTLRNYYHGDLRDKKVTIWGAAFKPKTDDIRESPAIYTVKRLLDYGSSVCIYDPLPRALENFKQAVKFNNGNGRISYAKDRYEALDGSSALLIVTDWDQFKSIDHDVVKSKLIKPVVIDSRNLYSPEIMEENGFDYLSFGRPSVFGAKK